MFKLPVAFPNRRILSIDIGGTLAKAAFYVPKSDPHFKEPAYHDKLAADTIPSKYNLIIIINYLKE
jgi:hypothetical protein